MKINTGGSPKKIITGLLKDARDSKNINQSEMAALLDVSQPNVSERENEERFPSTKTLVDYADALGMELHISFV